MGTDDAHQNQETTASAEKAGTVRYNWGSNEVRNTANGGVETVEGVQLSFSSISVRREMSMGSGVWGINRRPMSP